MDNSWNHVPDAPEPPDPKTWWACDGCREVFDGGDLTEVGDDRWFCTDCQHEFVVKCNNCGYLVEKSEGCKDKDGFTLCLECAYELGEE